MKLREEESISIIDLTSDLKLENVAEFQSILNDAATRSQKVVINLSGINSVNSQVIGVISSTYRKLTRSGGNLKLAGATGPVQELLKVVRLDKIIGVYPSVDKAIDSF